MTDRRGAHRKLVAEENRKAVLDFFLRHPGASHLECAYRLGIQRNTVSRHVDKIRKDWPFSGRNP